MPARRMPVPSQSSVTSQAPTRTTVAATGADTGVPAATNTSAPRCTEAGAIPLLGAGVHEAALAPAADAAAGRGQHAPADGRLGPVAEAQHVTAHRQVERAVGNVRHQRYGDRADLGQPARPRRGRGGTAPTPSAARSDSCASSGAHGLEAVGDDPAAAGELLGVRVVGLEDRLLLLAHRADGAAREHQRPDGLDLGVGQRQDLVVAAGHLDGDLQRARRVAEHQRLHRGGDVRDAPRVHQVAEVDQAGGHHPAGAVARRHDVVVGDVGVHDLLRQRRLERRQQRLGRLQQAAGLRAAGVVLHPVVERLDDGAGELQVPLDGAVGARVREVGERLDGLGGDAADGPQRRGRAVGRGVERGALDVGDEPDLERLAVARQRLHQVAGRRGDRARHRERQVARGQVAHRRVLRLERDDLPAGVRDLEDEPAVGRVDAVVAVLVRPELAHRPLAAEQVARDDGRLVDVDRRAPQREVSERVLVAHREADADTRNSSTAALNGSGSSHRQAWPPGTSAHVECGSSSCIRLESAG